MCIFKSALHQVVSHITQCICCLIFVYSPALASPEYAAVTDSGDSAVASVNPLATKIGLDVYAKGGNAIDAAVAVAFALGVVDSHNSGIGGGCFIIARLANGEIVALDGREMAPAAAHRDMFIRDGEAVPELSKSGALAIGIPGSVAALSKLQKAGGHLEFRDAIIPSITLAENGFPINAVLAARLKKTQSVLEEFPESKSIFLPDGKLLRAGDIFIQKDLATTYRKLAAHGPSYFYRGEFAQQVHEWMQKNNGIVTRKDFRKYRLIERQPLRSTLGEYTLVGFPPPSSGGIHVAQILSLLSERDVGNMNKAQRYHLIIEASKLAFADRAYWLGDADFVPVPRGLLDPEYLVKRAQYIDLKKANNEVVHGVPKHHETDIFNKHTTHIATADKHGNWVAITTTLNTSFGSKVTIPGTGVLMNNQMDDFSIKPGEPNAFGLLSTEANSVAAGKRPLSSMSPTIILKNGEPVMTVGAAGGPTIISQVSQTILNHLILGLPLDEAMATARVHHQWKPNTVFIDEFASNELKKSLQSVGHQLKIWPPFGATQAIVLKNGKLLAEAEPRIQ